MTMHRKMAETMDTVIEEIKASRNMPVKQEMQSVQSGL